MTVVFVEFVEWEMTSPVVVVDVAASIRFRLLAAELQFQLQFSARPGGSVGDCSAEPVRPWFGGWLRNVAQWG